MVESTQHNSKINFMHMLKLASPIFFSNLALVSSSTIDTFMVGQLSTNDLAGVAMGIAIATWISISLAGVVQGVSPIVGFAYGAHRLKEVGKSLEQCLYLALALSIPGVALTVSTDMWMAVSGITGDVAVTTQKYLFFVAGALPAILLGRCFIAVNAAVSRPTVSMCVTLVTVALRGPCNMLFIEGVGDWQGMGGAGVGLSAFVLSWGALVAYWLIWRLDPYFLPMRLSRIERPDPVRIFRQLRIGVPMGFSIFFEMTSYSLMAIFIARTGVVMLAAHQIVSNLIWLYYVIPFAVGVSGMVLVSQSLGAKKPECARKVTFMVMGTAFASAVVVSAATWLFRDEIVVRYTQDLRVQEVAITFLSVAAIYHIVDAVQCAGICVLRGYRITVLPMVVYCVLLCGVGLAIGYYTSGFMHNSYYHLGAIAFWIGATTGLLATALVIAPYTLVVCNRRAMRRWFDFSFLEKTKDSFQ